MEPTAAARPAWWAYIRWQQIQTIAVPKAEPGEPLGPVYEFEWPNADEPVVVEMTRPRGVSPGP